MFKVEYKCRRCSSRFTVIQNDLEPDEDIDLCWECIDQLLTGKGGTWIRCHSTNVG